MKLKSINPSTEEIIGEFEIYSKDRINKAVQKARTVFEKWRNSDIKEREKPIKEFHNLLIKNKNIVAELIPKEMGKPLIEANGELDGALETINWFLLNTRKFITDEEIKLSVPKIKAKLRFEPVGVIGIITPWNFPIDSSLWKIIPALLTGNTVVYKPSELSTFCGLKISELFRKTSLPEGVFNIVTGDQRAGKNLVSSNINMISFTGSSKAGKDVAQNAGKCLKKFVLELGGSDPFIVFEDAIIDQAINAAIFGRFLNCGQVCTAAKRIFVQDKVYDFFVKKFVERASQLKVENSLGKDTEIGPLVSKKQLEILEAQIKDAISKGAGLLLGGKKLGGKGYFFQPTVLTNIKENMKVLNEEVFGPVASIISFKSIEEAIKLANNTKYGLGASVWSSSKEKAKKMIENIESGMIWVNDFGTPYYECPQGGIKKSGIGRELSKYGILEFCNIKTVVESQDKTIKKSWWFPYH